MTDALSRATGAAATYGGVNRSEAVAAAHGDGDGSGRELASGAPVVFADRRDIAANSSMGANEWEDGLGAEVAVWVLGGAQWGPPLQVLSAVASTAASIGDVASLGAGDGRLGSDGGRRQHSAQTCGIALQPVTATDKLVFSRQELYFSERTGATVEDAPTEPNTLLVAECCIARENIWRPNEVASAWHTELYSSCGVSSGGGGADVSLSARAAAARRAQELRQATSRNTLAQLRTDALRASAALAEATDKPAALSAALEAVSAYATELSSELGTAVADTSDTEAYTQLMSTLATLAPEFVAAHRDLEKLRRRGQGGPADPQLPVHVRTPYGICLMVSGGACKRSDERRPEPDAGSAADNRTETESSDSRAETAPRSAPHPERDELQADVLELTPEEFDDANVPLHARRGGIAGNCALYVVNDDGTSGCWARDSSEFTGGLVVRRRRRTASSNSNNHQHAAAGDESRHGNALSFKEGKRRARIFYDEFRVRKRILHPGERWRRRDPAGAFDSDHRPPRPVCALDCHPFRRQRAAAAERARAGAARPQCAGTVRAGHRLCGRRLAPERLPSGVRRRGLPSAAVVPDHRVVAAGAPEQAQHRGRHFDRRERGGASGSARVAILSECGAGRATERPPRHRGGRALSPARSVDPGLWRRRRLPAGVGYAQRHPAGERGAQRPQRRRELSGLVARPRRALPAHWWHRQRGETVGCACAEQLGRARPARRRAIDGHAGVRVWRRRPTRRPSHLRAVEPAGSALLSVGVGDRGARVGHREHGRGVSARRPQDPHPRGVLEPVIAVGADDHQRGGRGRG
eukprot:ctg_144.g143